MNKIFQTMNETISIVEKWGIRFLKVYTGNDYGMGFENVRK